LLVRLGRHANSATIARGRRSGRLAPAAGSIAGAACACALTDQAVPSWLLHNRASDIEVERRLASIIARGPRASQFLAPDPGRICRSPGKLVRSQRRCRTIPPGWSPRDRAGRKLNMSIGRAATARWHLARLLVLAAGSAMAEAQIAKTV